MSDLSLPLGVEQYYPFQFFSGNVANGGIGAFNTMPTGTRGIVTHIGAGTFGSTSTAGIWVVQQTPGNQWWWVVNAPAGAFWQSINPFIVFDPLTGPPTINWVSGSNNGLSFQVDGYLAPR